MRHDANVTSLQSDCPCKFILFAPVHFTLILKNREQILSHDLRHLICQFITWYNIFCEVISLGILFGVKAIHIYVLQNTSD